VTPFSVVSGVPPTSKIWTIVLYDSTAQRHNPEDLELNVHHRENFKSHTEYVNILLFLLAFPVQNPFSVQSQNVERFHFFSCFNCLWIKLILDF
jgi:hypothetical protein